MSEETNGLESTGNPLVDAALSRIRERFSDLEDAMLVQSQIEKRQTALLKDHAEWLAENTKALTQHRRFLKHHRLVMREIEDKLNALIEREIRREGL